MTSFAFILGVVPLVIATAPAPNAPGLGLAVFSGMLGVTFFGIFLTPVFYHVIQRSWRTPSQSANPAALAAAFGAFGVGRGGGTSSGPPGLPGGSARAVARRGRARLTGRQANLPAAAQCPVDLDQAQGDFALGLRQRVFGRHQVLLQEGHAGKIDRAGRVLGQGDLDGPGRRRPRLPACERWRVAGPAKTAPARSPPPDWR